MAPSASDDADSHRELLRAFRRAVVAKIERDLAAERTAAEALRSSVVAAVKAAVEQARAEGACGRVWLFGSFAWGQPGSRSDVDLLIEGPRPSDAAYLVGCATNRMVHAIELDRAPESLRVRVFESGVPL